MTRRIRHSVGGLLLLVLAGLAASDALCAWPCALGESRRGAAATAPAASHDCHSAPGAFARVTATPDASCAMEHGDAGPPADGVRIPPALVPPVSTTVLAAPAAADAMRHAPPPAARTGGPPGARALLRI